MREKVSLILALLLIISSFSTSISLANSNEGLEQFLDIFIKMDPDKRTLGSQVLNVYLQDADNGIENLKNDLGTYLTQDNVNTLNSMGYSLDYIKTQLDRLNSWSLDERIQLVNHISNGDSNGIKQLINSAGTSIPTIPGGGAGGGGAVLPVKEEPKKEETKKEESKKEELIKVSFKDIKGHKNEEAIVFLGERGIIAGKSPEKYDPDGELTRAEFMGLIYRVLGIKPTNDKPLAFKDVKANSWYYEYIKAAFDNKIITGTSPTTFSPDAKVSREAMVSILMRILKDKGIIFTLEKLDKDILMFVDADKISDWATEDMFYGVKYGIIEGRTDSSLNPRDSATRGEAAEIIKKLFDLIRK